MKYIVIFQLFLGALYAHGKEHEHLHFFSSLHVEYFLLFLAGLIGSYFVYAKFFRGER